MHFLFSGFFLAVFVFQQKGWSNPDKLYVGVKMKNLYR